MDDEDNPGEPGELLLRASHVLRRRMREVLQPYDISPHQARGLGVIRSAGSDGLRLGVLADRLRVVPRSVTELVDALVAKGLVERVPDPADRRAVVVRVTDQGTELSGRVHAARSSQLREWTANLPPDDQEELVRLLRLLLRSDA